MDCQRPSTFVSAFSARTNQWLESKVRMLFCGGDECIAQLREQCANLGHKMRSTLQESGGSTRQLAAVSSQRDEFGRPDRCGTACILGGPQFALFGTLATRFDRCSEFVMVHGSVPFLRRDRCLSFRVQLKDRKAKAVDFRARFRAKRVRRLAEQRPLAQKPGTFPRAVSAVRLDTGGRSAKRRGGQLVKSERSGPW